MNEQEQIPRPQSDVVVVPWRGRPVVLGIAIGVAGLVVIAMIVSFAAGRRTSVRQLAKVATVASDSQPSGDSARRLETRLAALRPRDTFLVIDSFGNRLQVFRDGQVLREAVCSTGSGTVLIDPSGRRRWTFDTPAGERRVQRKVRNPVWSKPDWAFIEEGYQPPTDPRLRVDTVSLGDYALYLGDGYIIHGTLFQTLLGRGVTHGCVRLGDEDLEYVYRTVPVGARVYLY